MLLVTQLRKEEGKNENDRYYFFDTDVLRFFGFG